MRMLVPVAIIGFLASAATATVSINVYLADEQTPLPLADPNIPGVYRDIMVGTRLTFVVSSETEQMWSGFLWTSYESWAIGNVSGRDYVELIIGSGPWALRLPCYVGSCLEAAGQGAYVSDTNSSFGIGMAMSCGDGIPGADWFILDYHAKNIGVSSFAFYEIRFDDDTTSGNTGAWPGPEPPPGSDFLLDVMEFHHVPSRDYNRDTVVNLVDFAILADRWRQVEEADPNAVQTDLDADGFIGIPDMALFSEYWLERTDIDYAASDPNDVGTGG